MRPPPRRAARRPDLHLRVGTSEFCGIPDPTVHLAYDPLDEPDLAGIDAAVSALDPAIAS